MQKYFFIYTFFFLLASCDSPMNNRIRSGGTDEKGGIQQSQFQVFNLEVEYQWLSGPFGNVEQENQLMVFLYNSHGELHSLPQGQTLEFYSTMPSMGHPMADAGFFEEISTGIYLNKGIRYNMPGDWKNELWIMDEDFNVKDRLEWLDFF